jgi:hypothetical protein
VLLRMLTWEPEVPRASVWIRRNINKTVTTSTVRAPQLRLARDFSHTSLPISLLVTFNDRAAYRLLGFLVALPAAFDDLLRGCSAQTSTESTARAFKLVYQKSPLQTCCLLLSRSTAGRKTDFLLL